MALPMEIDVLKARDLKKQGVPFLDVREDWEVDICAIEGAQVIAMNAIPARLEDIPKDGDLVVFCHHGMRSLQVTQWLRQNGVKGATSMAGGIDSWARTLDPEMKTY
ncbi:MAG: rhodanese-like domain-containing protein [Magnetovibrionaceae bacterium]